MTKNIRPKALIFDWDNTLVDTWPAIHDALNHTLKAMGHEPWTFDQTKERVRKSMRDSFPGLFGDRWEEAGDIFYARFEESHIAQLVAMDGAEDCIKSLFEKGYYLSIVSNKTGKYLRQEVEHLGWGKYFQHILGAGDAPQDKPSSQPVDISLKNSGISKGYNVWFVGDTDVDLECAHNSECTGVLVRQTPPQEGEFDDFPPSWYFSSCTQLYATLANSSVWEPDEG